MAITQIDGTRQIKAGTIALDRLTNELSDMITAGVTWKLAVDYATTEALPANTYAALALTADAVGILTVDGVATVLGDRILVKDEVAGKNNGVYIVTTEGTVGVEYVLTRADDVNESSEILAGMAMFVQDGTANVDMGYVLTTNDPIVMDTTALVFTQFTTVGQIIAGAGLTKTEPSTIDVGAGNGIAVDADSIRVNLDGTSLSVGVSGLKSNLRDASLKIDTGIGINLRDASLVIDGSGTGLNLRDASLVIDGSGTGVKLDSTSLAIGAGGVRVDYSNFVVRETPAGAVNGANATYVLAATPYAGSEQLFLNGLLQEPGAEDYSIAGDTITMVDAPLTGDRIKVSYTKNV